jgi:hypothetical protein
MKGRIYTHVEEPGGKEERITPGYCADLRQLFHMEEFPYSSQN